jgi:transcriptional regulator of acetoin/glycerol metabolism
MTWMATGRVPSIRLHCDAAFRLLEHEWPFNMRELLQVFQTSALLADAGVVRSSDLPSSLGVAASATMKPPPRGLSPEDEALREQLLKGLEASNGNITHVAREMGKARQQVQRWMRRFGLSR